MGDAPVTLTCKGVRPIQGVEKLLKKLAVKLAVWYTASKPKARRQKC
jgi:hypothetical protein